MSTDERPVQLPDRTTSAHAGRGNNPVTGRGRNRNNRPRWPLDVAGGAHTVNSTRIFGGYLTQVHPQTSEFVPTSVLPLSTIQIPLTATPQFTPATGYISPRISVDHTQSPAKGGSTKRPKRRASLSRSNAPDIATRMHEDISKGIYECAICTNEVARNSKIWSCQTCWTVFHLACIRKWSKNEGATVPHRLSGDDVPKHWRCPGCNLPKDVLPNSYTCWCQKEMDPKPIAGLPPHSCGNTCGRRRTFPKLCPHRCDLLCHAGPCLPCTQMGPSQLCFCGKEVSLKKCTVTDYDEGWSCEKPCGDIMPCGEHFCQKPCHQGLCGACKVAVVASCYCGKVEKVLSCCDRQLFAEEGRKGSFECGLICETPFDCSKHRCEKLCHAPHESIPHCPLSPDTVSHCPCGKTPLSLLTQQRESCLDKILQCNQICAKPLSCGHFCAMSCHSGTCSPCSQTVSIPCRCGRTTLDSICHQELAEPPQCSRICKTLLSCGRHECSEHCCTGERKGLDRQATKRKLKTLTVGGFLDDSIETEHICTRRCDRPLKCGNHKCAELCHKGPCGSCKEALFEDQSCSCGRTTIQAPLPCGTQPPSCRFPCTRSKECGHPQVVHNCHSDEDSCPNCPFLTEKVCLCGKKTLKNQPCWRIETRCGIECGKLLKCGSHYCRKPCHRAGECEDAEKPCQQGCGKPKKACGHPCEKPCHAPSTCREDRPCPFMIIVTCDCQRKREEVKCPARPSEPNPPGRLVSLKCDEECARLERNRSLAQALDIPDTHTDKHVPYSTNTLKLYIEDIAWAQNQEEVFRIFAADETERRVRFKPMKRPQREFLHSLAEDFGFDSESLDPEPHRHVMIFKTPRFTAAPMKTLAQAARIKKAQLNISPPVETMMIKRQVPYYNGFLLIQPKFDLTEDDLKPCLRTSGLEPIFLTATEDVAVVMKMTDTPGSQRAESLESLQPKLSSSIVKNELATSITLCHLDLSGLEPRIMHVQEDHNATKADGWSKVAAKKGLPMNIPKVEPIGQRPIYTVLGSKSVEAKRKKFEEKEKIKALIQNAVDDWETEI